MSDIVIRIDRKGLVVAGVLLFVGTATGILWSESLTLVTTYPAPSGVYNQLVTTGNSGATPADTILNRGAGNTLLVPATNAAGMVGVGMAPVSKLSVAGGIRVGDDASACTAAKEGTLRWHGANLEACKGGTWVAPSSGGPGGGGYGINNNGTCFMANNQTGGCSCPAGTSVQNIGYMNTFAGPVTSVICNKN